MAISIDDIKKLRAMTGAGLADVKKALTEAEGDFDKAKELLRERGLAIAAKRSDRETSNGCVLVKKVDGFAAMLALKCETDFVANGADFIALTQAILDAAIAAKAADIEAVKNLTVNGEVLDSLDVGSLCSDCCVEDGLCECDEVSTISHEVGLTLECEHGSEAIHLLYEYTTIRCLTVATLGSDSEATLAEELLGLVEVALGLGQCLLYVGETSAGHSAKLLDIVN